MTKLKKPSDYGQFFFRIDKKDKETLEDRLQTILDKQMALTSEDDLQPKRNHLILEALKIGLAKIENDLKKNK